jgi:hypothetical protein
MIEIVDRVLGRGVSEPMMCTNTNLVHPTRLTHSICGI